MTRRTCAWLALVGATNLFAAGTAQADPVSANDGALLTHWSPTRLGVIADGTSNTLLFTDTTRLGICVGGVTFPGGPGINPITDGSSNTLLFRESSGFDVNIWRIFTRRPVGQIADGSSNTILVEEGPQQPPTDAFCLSGVTPRNPAIEDGTSNTILFGEDTSIDICVDNARIGITDGTSNTILFGEVVPRTCFDNVTVSVPEPATFSMLAVAAAVMAARCRGRRGSSPPTACR